MGERRAFLTERSLFFACCGNKTTFEDDAKGKRLQKVQRTASDIITRGRFHKKKGILLQTILPVIITQKGTSKSVKTYASYDNESSGCFLSENHKNCLEAASTKTQLQLATMLGQSIVDSAVVEELIVSDPNGTNPIELPRA